MLKGALEPYERTLRRPRPLHLLAADGTSVPLEVERYLGRCDAADRTVLERCRGPVLDIGCGPGRFVVALAGVGTAALGIDMASTAVNIARGRGVPVLRRDLFGHLPGEGRWRTALLMDGNIGIGGDVSRMLGRLDSLLASDGRALVETAHDPYADTRLSVQFAVDEAARGPAFPWAVIGVRALAEKAARAGLFVIDQWTVAGRSFAALARGLEQRR